MLIAVSQPAYITANPIIGVSVILIAFKAIIKNTKALLPMWRTGLFSFISGGAGGIRTLYLLTASLPSGVPNSDFVFKIERLC